jgi:signal transduction histidine kinase
VTRLLGLLALATVVAVNAAGLWSISASRRGAADEAARLLRMQVEARAQALEGRLAALRAELSFLADTPPVLALLRPGAPRDAAESALLLFLRAHPELLRIAVTGTRGEPILAAGRRGGVPILWLSSRQPTGGEGVATAPDSPRLATSVAVAEAPGATLEIEVSPGALLDQHAAAACRLLDAGGRVVARAPSQRPALPAAAEAAVAAPAWSRPGPWRLTCDESPGGPAAMLEPVAARYRTTLALNLGAMALALALGLLAFTEVRRRERLEASAREEARVRELERQLFHAERLASVGRLAAGIAHEINNPLEGIANYLSLARDALGRGDHDGLGRHLEGVRAGLERAALVVRQVLAQADAARAPKSRVDLNQVLQESAEFVRSRREFARLRFESALLSAPLPVLGNPVMLGQVALNLLLNACEAQPEGGEVRVASRRENDSAVAEIADRGPGIGEAARARLFEPFFSTKNSTGLGLSICHGIVERHGGQLEALPREGGGSVFRLTLPLAAAPSEVA